MTYRIPLEGGADIPQDAVDALRRGELVAYPTETLYGLAVDPRQPDAVARLRRVKGREARLGLPLIAGSLTQVESDLGPLPRLGRRLTETFWPGPLTLIFVPTADLDAGITAADTSVAVRVPGAEPARRLALACGHPITATSANPAGKRPAATGDEVESLFGPVISLILEQAGALQGAPSTIVDIRGDAPVLVRAGIVSWDRVLQSVP
ncbi:MAG: threonylcarbamoyl-AMP synthase [Acidobacteria bacterium]|nr:threonylcarbamoyl-AMP synthase [Acidobacteriota bacterium]